MIRATRRDKRIHVLRLLLCQFRLSLTLASPCGVTFASEFHASMRRAFDLFCLFSASLFLEWSLFSRRMELIQWGQVGALATSLYPAASAASLTFWDGNSGLQHRERRRMATEPRVACRPAQVLSRCQCALRLLPFSRRMRVRAGRLGRLMTMLSLVIGGVGSAERQRLGKIGTRLVPCPKRLRRRSMKSWL